MEAFVIKLDNDDSGSAFDDALQDRLPEGGDLAIAVKSKATASGKAGVCVHFTSYLDDMTPVKVQAVTTVANFIAAARALSAVYNDDGTKK